ncbi:MAG: DUF302 domain-containing protein [Planctomycetota bacterium]|jgi:uncharacterized protein (DUF302 family)
MSDQLSIDVELDASIDDAIEAVSAALKEEGFGVLTRIDVDKTLKEKIDVDFRPYVILGACNPVLAHKALGIAPEVGLMLPCNVTVEQAGDGSMVRLINARAMMQTSGLDLHEIADEADAKLRRVADKLRQ